MDKKQFPYCARFAMSLTAAFALVSILFGSSLQASDTPNGQATNLCAKVIGKEVTCEKRTDGTNKYTVTLTIHNLTHLTANPYEFAHATILPPAGFSPTLITPSPGPIPPGGVGTVTTCYYGKPGRICFNVGLHNSTLTECCTPAKICLDLPSGFIFIIKEIRVQTLPSPHSVLRFPTQAGLRYQIEQAPTVLGPWTTSTCTSPDALIDGDGSLVGTGGLVTCHVGGTAGESLQFFRGVERP